MRILVLSLFLLILTVMFSCATKFNSHLGPDGQGGYLRTYRSTEKGNPHTNFTGIERCTIQGSDIICRDLNIRHKK